MKRKIPITRKKFLRRKRYIDALIDCGNMKELKGKLNHDHYNEIWRLLSDSTLLEITQEIRRSLSAPDNQKTD
jgi:hypothetical protein